MGTVDDAVRLLGLVMDGAPEIIGGSMFRRGEEIVADAKEHYVPVDLGALRDSGYVEGPVIRGAEISVVMGFGGPSADYALPVHEVPANHAVGGWKYLETPAVAAQATLADDIAADILAGLEGLT